MSDELPYPLNRLRWAIEGGVEEIDTSDLLAIENLIHELQGEKWILRDQLQGLQGVGGCVTITSAL
jgi:hypothetical protein